VENWPLCDCLISFHSKGFPLEKAVMYTELRRPFVINDLYMQYKLQNRFAVFCLLIYWCIFIDSFVFTLGWVVLAEAAGSYVVYGSCVYVILVSGYFLQNLDVSSLWYKSKYLLAFLDVI